MFILSPQTVYYIIHDHTEHMFYIHNKTTDTITVIL